MPNSKDGSSSLFKFRIKKRKLSLFMCKEMLYDYVSGKLDEERTEAVHQFLEQSKEIQTELHAIQSALTYCEGLAKTEISEPLLKNIRDAKSPWAKFVSTVHWSQWPDSLKWGAEAIGISASVVLIALLVGPKVIEMWPKAVDQKVILAEVDAKKSDGGPPTGEEEPAQAEERAQPEPEKPAVEPLPPPKEVAVVEPLPPPVAPPTPAPASTTASPVEKSPEPTLAPRPPPVGATFPAEELKTPVESKPQATSGFLYRAFMNIQNADGAAESITAQLEALGAEKAGEVPLGWRRPKGAYYHFTLPEENYDKMMEQLRTYGEVRISKDPHPRVMPQGVIRLILWVEDVTLKQ